MQSNDRNRPLAKPIWIDRFCTRLMELRPGMNAVTAAQIAAALYSDASELEPEDAAEIVASVGPAAMHPDAKLNPGTMALREVEEQSFAETTPGTFRRRDE